MQDKLLTIQESAEILGISTKTLRRWDKRGILVPQRTAGNQRRYTREAVDEFRKPKYSQNKPIISANIGLPSALRDIKSDPIGSIDFSFAGPGPAKLGRKSSHNAFLLGLILVCSVFAFAFSIKYGLGQELLSDGGKLSQLAELVPNFSEIIREIKSKQLAVIMPQEQKSSVLAETDIDPQIVLNINTPSTFNNTAEFLKGLRSVEIATLSGGIITENEDVDAGTGILTASNVIYGLTAGTGISISAGQTPTITNTSLGTDQNIFKTIKVGSDSFSAGSTTDTLELAAGSNISLSTDTSNKKVTITGSSTSSSGWTDDGTTVRLTTLTDSIGIGTTSPSSKLDVLSTTENLRLLYDATNYTSFTIGSSGDLTLNPTGGDVIFADADVLNIGGSGSDTAYNIIGDSSAGASSVVDSDDDLYIEGNIEIDGTVRLNNVSYTFPSSDGSSDYILSTAGTGTLSWISAGGTINFWQRNSGALSPFNITDDILLGATSTTSAKFAVLNIAGGTPTASISANSGNNATFLTGLGNLATTNSQTLSLGGSTTGNISIDSGSSAISVLDQTTFGSGTASTLVIPNISLLTGTGNSIAGSGAGTALTSGTNNTLFGVNAGNAITTDTGNTFFGYQAGLLSTGGVNVAIGVSALDANTTGTANVAIGRNALGANTTASDNTAIGDQAMLLNISGTGNVAIGTNALSANTASNNTAVGWSALDANTSGLRNIAIGSNALGANTTGNDNIAIGDNALDAQTGSGDDNIAIGRNALGTATSAINNVAIGYQAMDVQTTGDNNVAVGHSALGASTTGDDNTAIGRRALDVLTTADFNTAVGADALGANTTAFSNTALGWTSGGSNTTGTGNVFLGYNSGVTALSTYANTTGSNNTFLGFQAGPGTATQLSNAAAIGSNALVGVSNGFVLGNVEESAGTLFGSSVFVGIGTASPSAALHVVGGQKGGNAAFILNQTGASTNDIFTASASGTTRLVISNVGFVGINDATPDSLLDILSATTGTDIIITNTNATDTDVTVGFALADGTNNFTLGVDDSVAGDPFKISTTALGTSDMLTIDSRTSGAASIAEFTLAGLNTALSDSASAEYTTLAVTPPTITLGGTTQVTAQMDSILFSQPTILPGGTSTVDDAATLTIAGPPIAGVDGGTGLVTITDNYALKINSASVDAGASGAVTNAYGLYVDAPTGASANYAATFATGNVGIGDTTPDSLLDILSATTGTNIIITNTNGTDTDVTVGFALADGTNNFTLGVDDSDGDKFKISTTALGTSDRLVIDSTGLVGVGTASPISELHVTRALAAGASGKALALFDQIESQDILTASASGVTKFVLDNAGKAYLGALDIETGNTTATCWFNNTINGATLKEITDCDGAPTDLAENFGTSDTSIEAGDVVAITGEAQKITVRGTPTSKAFIKKSETPYQSTVVGVVSTAPSELYGDDGVFDPLDNPKPVSLAGRVPVKVSIENGVVASGDPITSSSIPGVAMKATRAGQIIGKALESFSQDGIGKIMVFINLSWYDTVALDSIRSATGSAITFNLTKDGKFVIKNEEGAEAITFDSLGNVSFAGTLTADKIKANQIEGLEILIAGMATDSAVLALPSLTWQAQIASGSGILTASQASVSVKDLEKLMAEVKELSSKVDLLSVGASISAFLSQPDLLGIKDATISGRLNVLGRSIFSDVGITGNVNMGVIAINGLAGEINTLSGPLRLQSESLGGIDILAGKITIDTKGDIQVAGTISAEKIEANNYTVSGKDSIGSGTIPAGTTSVEISTLVASESSKIFLTATSLTTSQLTVVKKSDGKFKVAIAEPATSPITFDWWIVGNKNN